MKWHTDMRAWSDNQLDDLISDALRSTVVTPQQKRAAWQRLHESAATQTMLPPLPASYTAVPAADPLRTRVRAAGIRVATYIRWLLLDDTRYDRALRLRYERRHHNLLESPLRNMLGGVAT